MVGTLRVPHPNCMKTFPSIAFIFFLLFTSGCRITDNLHRLPGNNNLVEWGGVEGSIEIYPHGADHGIQVTLLPQDKLPSNVRLYGKGKEPVYLKEPRNVGIKPTIVNIETLPELVTLRKTWNNGGRWTLEPHNIQLKEVQSLDGIGENEAELRIFFADFQYKSKLKEFSYKTMAVILTPVTLVLDIVTFPFQIKYYIGPGIGFGS